MNAGSPKRRNSSVAEDPANGAGSKPWPGKTFRQPVTIARNSGSLAGALPWISPSWLPRASYHGTFSPSAVNGRCAASISPG